MSWNKIGRLLGTHEGSSTVDRDLRTSSKTGVVTRQECDSLSNFFRLTMAAEWMGGLTMLQELVIQKCLSVTIQ